MSDFQALYQASADAADSEPVVAEEKPKLGSEPGCALYKMMLFDTWEAGRMVTPLRCSAEREFRAVEDLQRFCFLVDTCPSIPTISLIKVAVLLESMGFESCVQPEIGADVSYGPNSYVAHYIHMKQNFIADRKLNQRKACGYFNQVINPKDGIIMVVDNFSPTEALRAEGLKDDSISQLKSWSDVVFLQWKSCASETSDLTYVVRYNVMYYQTNSIVEGINLAYGRDASPWPGHSYDAASEEGQALLGTPNGSCVAYMPIQHRRELGHKTVEKITVFYHKEEYLMLLFNIVDVNPTSNEQARTES